MTVVLDTSVLAAFLNPSDPLHGPASDLMARIMRGELGVPVSSDYVLSEGLTLLRRRPGRIEISRQFLSLFVPRRDQRAPVHLRQTTAEEVQRAIELHFRHHDRALSMTDCIVVGLSRQLGGPIASFDKGFDGIAPRVPPDQGS